MTHPGIRPSATNSLLFAGRSLPPTLADQDNWHVSRRISHDHDLDSAPARGQMTEMADAIAKTICVYPLRAPFHASEFRVAVVSTRLLPCYAPCFGATRTSVSTATHGFPRVSISVQLVGLRSRVRKFESCWGRFHPRRSACAQAAPGRLIFFVHVTPAEEDSPATLPTRRAPSEAAHGRRRGGGRRRRCRPARRGSRRLLASARRPLGFRGGLLRMPVRRMSSRQ
jgi:hypothetical protein